MPAATGSDLLNVLTRFRPHVVHFSGHANETILNFDSGDTKVQSGALMKATTFAKALEAVDKPARLVLLNACKSEAQLEALTSLVSVAVGMSDRHRRRRCHQVCCPLLRGDRRGPVRRERTTARQG